VREAGGEGSPQANAALLEGFRLLMQFLLEREADCLCGAPRNAHNARARVNCRSGYHARTLRTPLGRIPLLIPQLLHFTPRVSIVKRATRLAPRVLETLARVRASGVTPEETDSLIRNLWTIALPAALRAALVREFLPILETWRAGTLAPRAAHPRAPRRASASQNKATFNSS